MRRKNNMNVSLMSKPWSTQRASDWYNKNGWIVGCNYVPATAVNQLEMWQSATFDPLVIDRELNWAASLGFNTVRVFLHHLVWQQDPEAYLRRIDQFLSIASKHNIKTMLVLFDAVWDPYPTEGQQSEPRLHVHNSGWLQCPGFDILNDPSRYDELYSYVHGIISFFKDDQRVLLWDLYNEPDNQNESSYKDDYYVLPKAELSLQLIQKAMYWIRSINPSQPITMAPWKWADMHSLSTLDKYMFTHSDIISFHCYEAKDGMKERIDSLKAFGRPMICTEYMARGLGSTFQDILPLLKKHGIGAVNWGLVQGKSQAYCPWDSCQVNYEQEPGLWFHDIFRIDGEPYNNEEVEFIRSVSRRTAQIAA